MSKTQNGNCYTREAKHENGPDTEDNAFFQLRQKKQKKKSKKQMKIGALLLSKS